MLKLQECGCFCVCTVLNLEESRGLVFFMSGVQKPVGCGDSLKMPDSESVLVCHGEKAGEHA